MRYDDRKANGFAEVEATDSVSGFKVAVAGDTAKWIYGFDGDTPLTLTNDEVLAELQYAIPRVDHLRFTVYVIGTGTTGVFVPTAYSETADEIVIDIAAALTGKTLTITRATGAIALTTSK